MTNAATIDATTNLPSARLVSALSAAANTQVVVPVGSAAKLGSVIEVNDERMTVTGSLTFARNVLNITANVTAGDTVVFVDDTSQVDANPADGVAYLMRFDGTGAYGGNDPRDLCVIVDVDHGASTVTLDNPIADNWSAAGGSLRWVQFELDGFTPKNTSLDSLTVATRTVPVAHAQGSRVSKILTVDNLALKSDTPRGATVFLRAQYPGETADDWLARKTLSRGQWAEPNLYAELEPVLPLPAGTLLRLTTQTFPGSPTNRTPSAGELYIYRVADGAGVPVTSRPTPWFAGGSFAEVGGIWAWTASDVDPTTADYQLTSGRVEIRTAGTYIVQISAV